MAEKHVRFRVFRYKQGDPAPHYDTFTVTVNERTTVLEALQAIRRDQDGTLVLRHSCHHASCGTCGMRVNGREVLACVTNVWELDTPVVTVEPLQNAPLVSDLVVDMGPFYQTFTQAHLPLVRESEYLPESQVAEGVPFHMRFESCIECGLCVSACPVVASDPDYLGPATLAAVWRVVQEPRGEDADARIAWVDSEQGCWRCHVAMECSEVCPSNVDPGGSIMALRRELTRRALGIGRS
ncbi:MAG: succinate dehydrogenase/fumarate reductase iron-sulfur subunit [Chloroflexi bacterium]|nr:succinate dehydrogenase/fumarate reductase iron-sulfur subunit [Chloroflexota bacterium]